MHGFGGKTIKKETTTWQHSCSWDIKTKELECEGVKWIHLAQDGDQWWAVMKKVMKL